MEKTILESLYYISAIIGVFFVIISTFIAFNQVSQTRKLNLLDKKLDIYLFCKDFVLHARINGEQSLSFKDLHELYANVEKGKILYSSESKIVNFLNEVSIFIEKQKNSFQRNVPDSSNPDKKFVYIDKDLDVLKSDFIAIKSLFEKSLIL